MPSNEINGATYQLAQRVASVETSLKSVAEDVGEIKASVQAMQGTFQQGRGAAWVLMGVLSILGGLVSAGVMKWLHLS